MKPKSTWNTETEIEAYQSSKKTALDSFEDMQETTIELQSADPGYFGRLTAKIIDNLQVLPLISLDQY